MRSKILTIFILSILVLSSFAFAQTTTDQETATADDTTTSGQEIPEETTPTTEDLKHSDTEPTLVDFTKEKFSSIEAGTTPDHPFYYFFDRMFDTFQSPEEVAAERMHEALAMAEKARDSSTEEEKQKYLTYMQRPVELFNVYVDNNIEEIKNINEFKQLHEAETNLLVMKDIFEENKLLLESGEIVSEEESEVDNNLATVTLRFGDALAEVEVTKEELAEAKAAREEKELEDVKEEIEAEEKEIGIVDLRHTTIIKEYLDLKEDVENVDILIKNKEDTEDASKILTYARDTLLYRGEMDYSTIGETRKIILELKDALSEETGDTANKIESLKNEIIKIESERIQRDFDRKEQFEKKLAEATSDSEKLDLLDKYYNEETSGGLGFSHVSEIAELEANGLPREQAFQTMARASLEFGFNREALEKIAREISGNPDFKFSQTADPSIYKSPVSLINGDLGIYKSLTEKGIDKDTAAEIAVKGALTGLNRETVENLLKEKGYDPSAIKNYYEGGGQYYGREMHGDASPGTLFAIKQELLEQGISESEATRLAREEMINRLVDAGENPIRAIRRTDESERSLFRPVYGRFGDVYGAPAGSGLGVAYDRRVSELIDKGLRPDEARALATKEMSEAYNYGINTFGPGDASPGALNAAIAKAGGDIAAGKQALIDQLIASGNSLADATRRVDEAVRTFNVGYTGTFYGAPPGSGLGHKYDEYIREGLSPAEATKALKEEYKEQYKQELEKQGWTKDQIDKRLQEISTGYGNIGGPGVYYSGLGLGDASPVAVREKGVEAVRTELRNLGVSEAEIGIRIAEAQAAIAGTVSYTRPTGTYGDSARNTAYQELISSGLRPEQAASVLTQTPDFSHASLQETARQVTGNEKFLVSTTGVGVYNAYYGDTGYTGSSSGVTLPPGTDISNLKGISEREAEIFNSIPSDQKQGLPIEKFLEQSQQIKEQAKKEYINDLIGRGVDSRQAEELYRIQTTPIPLGGQNYGQVYGAPAGVVNYGAPSTYDTKTFGDYGAPAPYSSGLAQVGTTVVYGGQTYTVTADKGWTDSSGRAVPPPPGQPSSAVGTSYSGPGYTSYSGGGTYYSGPRSGLGDASPAAIQTKGVEGVRTELRNLGVSEAEIGQRIAEAQSAIASSGGSYYSGTQGSSPNYQTAYSGTGYTNPSGSYSGSGGSYPSGGSYSGSGSYSGGSYSGSGSPSGSYSGGSYSGGSGSYSSSGSYSGGGSYSGSGSPSGSYSSGGSYSGSSYSGGGDSGGSSSGGSTSTSSSSNSGSSSSSGGDSGGSAPSGSSGGTPTGAAIIKIMGNTIKNFFASLRD